MEHPIFDGPYSNDCYVARVREALDAYQEQSGKLVLRDWDAMVFHLPYAFQGRRMWAEIALELVRRAERLHEIEAAVGQTEDEVGGASYLAKLWSKTPHYKAYVKSYITPGERASQYIGNMYTASIFMALLSTLVDSRIQGIDISGRRIGFLSYGSGSKSKVFSGIVQPNYLEHLEGVRPFDHLKAERRSTSRPTKVAPARPDRPGLHPQRRGTGLHWHRRRSARLPLLRHRVTFPHGRRDQKPRCRK